MVHERNVRNMMQELIGARLIRLSEMGFVVELPDGNTRSFKFYEDSGDCCGYNKFTANMVLHEDAPAITNISFYESSYGEGHTLIITFFGVSRPIAKISSYSSSGSGWEYGACVTVTCRETGETQTLTEW